MDSVSMSELGRMRMTILSIAGKARFGDVVFIRMLTLSNLGIVKNIVCEFPCSSSDCKRV